MMDTSKFGNVYTQLDSIIGSASSVLFGSTNLSKLPVSELVHFFGLNLSVCNRSLIGLTPATALNCLNECVLMLNPNKVFLGFGDELNDLSESSIRSYIASYEELINRIVTAHDCDIYVLSPISTSDDKSVLYDRLMSMAAESGCNFIDISACMQTDRPMLSLFRTLSHYVRDSRISFTEAMKLASIAH